MTPYVTCGKEEISNLANFFEKVLAQSGALPYSISSR